MGKNESPAGSGPLARGLAAYQETLNRKNNPSEAAPPGEGLLKTGPGKAPPKRPLRPGKAPSAAAKELSKYQRAARFLVLVGSDEAARILSQLDAEQVEAISKEIAGIKGITAAEGEEVLEEFSSLLASPYVYSGSSLGGVEAARRLLYAAFGPEKGESVLKKAVPAAVENLFDFLRDFSGEQLALFFKDESPAAEALVLSRLPSKLSASALANTSAERKLEIVKRIARMGQVSPEVLERAAAALREKARHFERAETSELDGMGALTAILKSSDLSFGDRLLEELEEKDPALGRTLKERFYTLEDIAGAADRPIQEKLRAMSDRDIAILLKGGPEKFTAKILSNLSSGREGQVREEMEIMGKIPKIETEAAAREFLGWFRLNREEGRILMLDDKDVVE
ncbi:MAG: flagellar motor switch protein FliG [Treponema sp.]|jgi:flagellar motor switch protein FliG|nr:flagellar motor switch protein FliG [Treponema sp.]